MGVRIGGLAEVAVIEEDQGRVVRQEIRIVLVRKPGMGIRRDDLEISALPETPEHIAGA